MALQTLEKSTLNTRSSETYTQQELQLSATANTRQHSQHSESTPEIKLRDYQKAIISKTYAYIREGAKRILLVAIMGSGKTITASWIMRDATKRQRRCVFLVALNVLLDQTTNTLQTLGVECSVLQADRKFNIDAPVIVASLQTIGARLRAGKTLDEILGQVDVCIADEAHITAFTGTYLKIEKFYLSQGTIFLGLTATPWRLSVKEWLGQHYDRLVVGPQPPEIIKLGGALPCRGFTFTNTLDLDDLHIRNGEYIDSEISAQACRHKSLENVYDEWYRLASDRPTLMIGATVAQAEATRNYFLDNGTASEMIVGSTPTLERHEIFNRVADGQTKVITSVGCLTAGFDLPCISAILYVRATRSRSLFHQSAGRGSRPYPGKKDYLLLDFGANLKRHQNPMGFQDYDIFTPKDFTPCQTKTCPSCGHECYFFTLICPVCGHEFETAENESDDYEDEFSPVQLNEYHDSFTKKKIKALRTWKRQAWKNDTSPDEPADKFVREFGHIPPAEWLIVACLGKKPTTRTKQKFLAYLKRHLKPANKWADSWIDYHLIQEFGSIEVFESQEFDWWQILNCTIKASWQEIKEAYKALAMRYHPDVYNGEDAHEKMVQINNAFAAAKAYCKSNPEEFF